MKQSLQEAIQDELPDADYPEFEPGDKIRVTTTQDIQGQQRKRHFEGVCIGRKGEGPDKTFKVRKVSFGVGVERIYPLHSPIIDDIEIVKKGKVRRAKLSYLEGRSAKESRIDEERVDLEEVNRTRSGSSAETEETAETVTEDEEQETETAGDDEPEAADEAPADEDAGTQEKTAEAESAEDTEETDQDEAAEQDDEAEVDEETETPDEDDEVEAETAEEDAGDAEADKD